MNHPSSFSFIWSWAGGYKGVCVCVVRVWSLYTTRTCTCVELLPVEALLPLLEMNPLTDKQAYFTGLLAETWYDLYVVSSALMNSALKYGTGVADDAAILSYYCDSLASLTLSF